MTAQSAMLDLFSLVSGRKKRLARVRAYERVHTFVEEQGANAKSGSGRPFVRVLKRIIELLKITPRAAVNQTLKTAGPHELRDALDNASPDPSRQLLWGGLGAFVAGAVLYFLGPFGWSMTVSIALVVTAFVLSALGCSVILRFQRSSRQKRIRDAMPDFLDLVVVCAEAGLGIDQGVRRAGIELTKSAPELSQYITLAADEMSMLPNRLDALNNLAIRLPYRETIAFAEVFAQTERFGTPVAPALRVLAADIREKRLLAAEEKAAKLPATLTIPLIIFILPSLFAVLLSPAALRIYDLLTRS